MPLNEIGSIMLLPICVFSYFLSWANNISLSPIYKLKDLDKLICKSLSCCSYNFKLSLFFDGSK